MKNDSTPVLPSKGKTTICQQGTQEGPKQTTLNFLRQFARVYTCAAALPPALGSFIAN